MGLFMLVLANLFYIILDEFRKAKIKKEINKVATDRPQQDLFEVYSKVFQPLHIISRILPPA